MHTTMGARPPHHPTRGHRARRFFWLTGALLVVAMLWTSQPKPPAKAVKRVQARRQQEQHLVEPALEAEVDEEQAEAVEEDEQMMEADADGLEDDEGAAALEPPGEGGSGDADVPLPLAAAEKKAKKQPPEEEEEEEFDDEEEEGEEQQELEQAEEQREQEQEAEVEEPAAAAGKQARQQQQQQGGQGERSAASIEDEEAAIIERQCSDANRAAVEARVFNGSQPPVMAWGCENESVGALPVVTTACPRQHPRLPCIAACWQPPSSPPAVPSRPGRRAPAPLHAGRLAAP